MLTPDAGSPADPPGGASHPWFASEGFDPAEEGLREALTSTGNGYLCTRGAAEWEDADNVHYPGTYGHGSTTGRRPCSAVARCSTRNW